MKGLLRVGIAGSLCAISLQPDPARSADPEVRVGVECGFAGGGYFPFSAGKDRCWEPINGRTMTPKAVVACAVKRADGSLTVRFHFSERAGPECDSGHAASKEEWTRALPHLGAKERAFVLSHVDGR